jgi:hypothetical protein
MTPSCVLRPQLLDGAERAALLAESRDCRSGAVLTVREHWQVVDGWQFLGPARFSYSLDGDVHRIVADRLAVRAGAELGTPLRAVQSNFLYYEPGDFLGLHHDQERCPVTVIALLEGDAAPLCTHPELTRAPVDRLALLVDAGGDCAGERVDLAAGPLLIHGGEIPHHRLPHPGPDPLSIVTFCFTPTVE